MRRGGLQLVVTAALGTIAVAAVPTRAHAEPPRLARVLTAPTAWLIPAGTVVGSASLDHRGDGALSVLLGLGDLATVELGGDTDVRTCDACGDAATPRWIGRAAFRVGARQDAWFAGMPALALGMRAAVTGGNRTAPRVSEAQLVASRSLGPLRLHAGATLTAAGFETAARSPRALGPTLRPLAGLEWTPRRYPRTALLADVAWVARLDSGAPRLEWVAGWGVRYQAVRWSAIELAVRHREDEGLGQSTVMIRIHAAVP